jgi:hypothetical protein
MSIYTWIRCVFIVLGSMLFFGAAGAVIPLLTLIVLHLTVGLPEPINDPFIGGFYLIFGGLALGGVGLMIGLAFGLGWAGKSCRWYSYDAERSRDFSAKSTSPPLHDAIRRL